MNDDKKTIAELQARVTKLETDARERMQIDSQFTHNRIQADKQRENDYADMQKQLETLKRQVESLAATGNK